MRPDGASGRLHAAVEPATRAFEDAYDAGLAVEGKVRETRHWDVLVRLDDGTTQTLRSDAQPFWHGGERVRLLDGKLTPAG